MALMATIRAARVEAGTLALWFLGQNGWVIKSPGGTVVAVDPYLSDSCNPSRRGLDLARRLPVPIDPAALEADLVACTHGHRDHADPVTLAALARSGKVGRFLGPAETQGVFVAAGIADGVLAWPNSETVAGDLRLVGTFALPTDTSDLTHMGFVIKAEGGPSLWITGDTAWCELVAASGAAHRPDAVCVCINGGYANLSHWEAAELIRRVDPAIAIPCHWDMFADNSCDPAMFRASLTVKGVREKYRRLDAGESLVICRTTP